MGNHISHHTGKVLLPDGTTHEFHDPLTTVAELMLEYPQRVVVEYQPPLPQTNGRPRLTPLPADKKLEMGKLYLMLPYKPGRPVSLSTKEAHHLLTRANDLLRARAVLSSSYNKFLPFFSKMMMCPSESGGGTGTTQIEVVRKGKMDKKSMCHDDNDDDDDLFGNNNNNKDDGLFDHHPLSRQVSGKGWKPSLDTIEEIKKDDRRRLTSTLTMGRESHWVIVASKVVKRIEKGGLVWA